MESSGRTLVCSVLFLDIVEYSKKPVSEQLQLKQEFNRALTKALEQVPARDRIILDTGDGAAVTFMGDPEDALSGPSPAAPGEIHAQAHRKPARVVAHRHGGEQRILRIAHEGDRGAVARVEK